MSNHNGALPIVIAGPIVRHLADDTFTLWLVTSVPIEAKIQLFEGTQKHTEQHIAGGCLNDPTSTQQYQVTVGSHCYIQTLIVEQGGLLKDQGLYEYDVELLQQGKEPIYLSRLCPSMLYDNQKRFNVKYSATLKTVLHGSCRKAHFHGDDALPQVDNLITDSFLNHSQERPDLLLFTGDQVYIDDVAGPTLSAIQQTIDLLGLHHESFSGSTIDSSQALYQHADCYYKRENLLPQTKQNKTLNKRFFVAKRKPIFTSVNAKNHLISLNEMLALYILSWSSRMWTFISLDKNVVKPEYHEIFDKERTAIHKFSKGLPKVERALAHIPVYMIFDDHDVTDDWNLTRDWEEQVYSHPFSRRIVGNALVAYLLCQGMGNPKSTWLTLEDTLNNTFPKNAIEGHEALIDAVLEHDKWQYRLNTSPPIQILDTRTQRWRSESNPNKPSGLMDWEALCDLQQQIIGQPSVIMVSAAPVYGVKFIEAVQRLFITFGGALIVDAENWMAHKGTASVMLNIFRHIKTPPHFIILSGDVHYSFVYDVTLRFRRNSPKITQFTCSGIHNQFPDKLITWFERLNRWLYGHRSPLNFLTKRRNMSIKERENDMNGLDVVNASSIGCLELNEAGQESACKLIKANGDIVSFRQS